MSYPTISVSNPRTSKWPVRCDGCGKRFITGYRNFTIGVTGASLCRRCVDRLARAIAKAVGGK